MLKYKKKKDTKILARIYNVTEVYRKKAMKNNEGNFIIFYFMFKTKTSTVKRKFSGLFFSLSLIYLQQLYINIFLN